MGLQQSNLSSSSSTAPAFDYVVAVTQDSINAALNQYLFYGKLSEVILIYVYDDNNNPVLYTGTFDDFKATAGGTDPFAVADKTASSDPAVQNLNNAYFAFGIKAKLGLPLGIAPANLPNILTLKPGQSDVTYTLMFSEFIATEIEFGPRSSITWVNQAQPRGTAWNFTGTVDLNFQDASFTDLTQAQQTQLKGTPGATFSVQQLYYDLNSSDLEQGFTFTEVPSNSLLNDFMTGDFINTYWKTLGGASMLGYTAKQTSTTDPASIAITDLNFFTPDAIGTDGAPLTLNYLCASNGHALPSTTHAGFGWNWIDASEVGTYDGVAALNRNTFAQYLNSARLPSGESLSQYVASNCYLPWVQVITVGTVLDPGVQYSWDMTPGQSATVNFPSTGSEIITYSYDSGTIADQAGDGGSLGRMELSCKFDLSVSVAGDQITIVQHLVIYTYCRKLATSDSGNVVDKQITDVYSIGVDGNGHLFAALASSTPVDNSKTPSANSFLNFFADVDKLSDDVTSWAQSIVANKFEDVPLSFVENFIFPGGATFNFADASFSDTQDLVSHITYKEQS
ncbi:hypothetical protein MTO98_17720 [Mucilaginibacter sp. SMC90]|uniref:hypothetical protein n=1 Tax=Mucilaginibacter sp. SMC90 TaxID=2929803 RepID=UPI001FB1EA5D|nr:hypothetical protein [Mucilaginibacter sp. SMC90]UOE46241.1 hypothetical protein MTO98_17720 [Mucilaginibacter sp. SMC90]